VICCVLMLALCNTGSFDCVEVLEFGDAVIWVVLALDWWSLVFKEICSLFLAL
jgi:hypothetical protein